MHPLTLAVALLATAPIARAQDLEYREFEVSDEDKALTVEGGFEAAWHEYNNLDFRARDESSDQSILDSDDRGGFAFSGASMALGYQVDPGVRFQFSLSHRGQWGGDQLGGTNRFGSMIYITDLNVELTPKPGADAPLKVIVGRTSYRLGGLADGREYILFDVLDMVRVDIPIGIGTLEVIPINVMEQTDNDGLDFVGHVGMADLPTFNFRGDTMMRRHGLVVRLDELPGPIDALAYAFYTDIGAGVSVPEMGLFSSGVDISYQGLLGNFTDNDWVMNAGVRASGADIGVVRPYAHFDMSSGIDRKELVAEDADTNGFAWGGGVTVTTVEEPEEGEALLRTEDSGFTGEVSYFDAFGPAYNADGMLISHGYVGMKAMHAGGTLFNRFLGFHPTAYVDMFGVTDQPHEPSRRSGTRVLHASAGYDFGKPQLSASWWFLQDTGISAVNFGRLDQITPPFGYARDEFRAEERMGKGIGQELNLDVGYQVSEALYFHANGAVILPGAYYEIEIARVAGDALGSANPQMPWGLNGGMKVSF